MWLDVKRATLFLSMAIIPAIALAEVKYPPKSLPDNGGVLGIQVEASGTYQLKGWEGVAIKVSSVSDFSPLRRTLHAGDSILMINGFHLRDVEDLVRVVKSISPGSAIVLTYLDSADDNNPKIIETKPVLPPQSPPNDDKYDETQVPKDLGFRYRESAPTHYYDLAYDAGLCLAVVATKKKENPEGKSEEYYDNVMDRLYRILDGLPGLKEFHITKAQIEEIEEPTSHEAFIEDMVKNWRLMEDRFSYCDWKYLKKHTAPGQTE